MALSSLVKGGRIFLTSGTRNAMWKVTYSLLAKEKERCRELGNSTSVMRFDATCRARRLALSRFAGTSPVVYNFQSIEAMS